MLSASKTPELFAATLGGMGLTGVILRCDFKMLPIQSRMIRRVTMRARDLDEVLEQFEATQGSTYSVAWIDSLGRGAALGAFRASTGRTRAIGRLAGERSVAAAIPARPSSPRGCQWTFPLSC